MKKAYFIGAWCIFISFIILMICSRSSFLYPCNDWNDANSFFTIGKAVMNGQVPYRDLFEQKGVYLYLIYGIAYLISNNSFLGVFILEVLSMAVFLFFSHKLIVLYCQEQTSLFLLPFLAFGLIVSRSFYWGGAAEEFCLPLMCISLYDTVHYFKDGCFEAPSFKMILKNGILAGIISLIKYTLLGFYFAWIGMIVLSCIVYKNYKKAINSCFVFGGGYFLAFLPCFIYFAFNGALDEWYQCYIYINIFLYSNLGGSISFTKRIYDFAKIMYWLILDNISYFSIIIIGMVYILFSGKNKWYEKVNIYMLFVLLFLGIYIGGANLPYYSIPLMVFAVIGIAAIGRGIDKSLKRNYRKGIFAVMMLLSILVSAAGAYRFSMNSFFISYEKEDFFLFKFKQIIEQEENPTLLTYNCLDAGLYTIADIMPTCRFFHRCNLDYDEMIHEQEQYLIEGKTKFVLTANTYPDIILKKYDLAAQEVYEQVGTEIELTYYLFKRKD